MLFAFFSNHVSETAQSPPGFLQRLSVHGAAEMASVNDGKETLL
jgi:hypothetical protein